MDIKKEYINLIKNDKNHFYEDYKETIKKMENSTAIYKGKPIPFLYQPLFFTNKDVKIFNDTVHTLLSITNKVVKQYIVNPSFRKKFGFSKKLENLILIDQGYPINVPIGRFDIFYGWDNNFKFCELNTDGSSAMNEDNTLAKIMLESVPIKILQENYQISYFELFDTWVNESMAIYQQFENKVINPTVAIVDFKENATIYEFEAFKKAYEKKGYKAVICDPRDLRYKEGKLYFNDVKIDLIYRRIVTTDLIDRYDEVTDLIKAYENKDVCLVGSFKSQIIHNKIIFKILHDDDTFSFLNQVEQDFIKKHIPLTKEFSNNEILYNDVVHNKNSYILKPKDSYGSKGVFAGLDYSNSDWIDIVNDAYHIDYLVQEYCVPNQQDFIVFHNRDIKIEPYKIITGLFVYNEKLAGLYTRIGQENIISGLHSYYTVCNLYANKK